MLAEDSRGVAPSRGARRWLPILAIWLLALVFRLVYFAVARVEFPIRGDIVQYVTYAINLVERGAFSLATEPNPATGLWPLDSFRGPGYPAYLAACFWIGGIGARGFAFAVLGQVLVGAALAPMTVLWCRRWMPGQAALVAGTLVAIWPHLVVFSSTLLSETFFAVEIVAFLWLLGRGCAGRDGSAAAAGLLGGLAYLTNPVFALFPPVATVCCGWRTSRRAALAMLAAFALLPGAWAVRNALHPGIAGASQRAAINLVEGSWPNYHRSLKFHLADAGAAREFGEIRAEEQAITDSLPNGMVAIGRRLGADPLRYAHWYLIDKPLLLWDWSIKIGAGDIYFLDTTRSPYERNPVFVASRALCRALNPVVFALALVACGFAFASLRAGAATASEAVAAAGLLVYLTLVHVAFQAEPRYAVAYRPLEIALAVYGAWRLLEAGRRRVTANGQGRARR